MKKLYIDKPRKNGEYCISYENIRSMMAFFAWYEDGEWYSRKGGQLLKNDQMYQMGGQGYFYEEEIEGEENDPS